MYMNQLVLSDFMNWVEERSPGEKEFHQAVAEFAESVVPYVNTRDELVRERILERMTEPDRVISFRVVWEDDGGNVQVNRGYRVQFNNAIGPYKGGLRFDPSVNLSILKFLGFEQTFKNSLTTLPLGGGKGGADFDPKGKSDREIMRFCHAFMLELHRHIGKYLDVPAGDIGVGTREVGYMFGMYKKLVNEFGGAMTGKGLAFGGSQIRTEATGYGVVYMAREMLARRGDHLDGKTALVSGSGNVAQYAVEKLIELGTKVVTMSDRGGTLYVKEGFTREMLEEVIEIKNVQRGRLSAVGFGEFRENHTPWSFNADLVFPCATQNELDENDAEELVKNGVFLVAEGANMPSTLKATRVFGLGKVLFAPSKAANAGGVAISGLEMSQNSMRLSWSRERVDEELQTIMKRIHEQCIEYAEPENGYVNYVKGANIAGFRKVAEAMLAFGLV